MASASGAVVGAGTSAPPTISTRNFLAGNMYLEGQIIVERHLHAFVTDTMRAKYPPTPAQAAARQAYLDHEAADAQEARDLPASFAIAEQSVQDLSLIHI